MSEPLSFFEPQFPQRLSDSAGEQRFGLWPVCRCFGFRGRKPHHANVDQSRLCSRRHVLELGSVAIHTSGGGAPAHSCADALETFSTAHSAVITPHAMNGTVAGSTLGS